MSNGYFKIDRKIFESDIWLKTMDLRLFIYLIGQTRWNKEPNTKYKSKGIIIKRGQFLRSYRNLQNDLEYIDNNRIEKYSVMKIKRAVDRLKKQDRIKTETTPLGTLFTVVNYLKYQNIKENDKEACYSTVTAPLQHRDNTNKEKKGKESNIPSNQDLPESYFDLSLKFHKQQKKNEFYHKDFKSKLNYKSPVVKNGAETIDKLIRLDNEPLDEIKKTLRFALTDSFWQKQIISLNGLRNKSKNNGNTKYFNIKNAMKGKHKEKIYSIDDLANLKIKPGQIEKYFNPIGDNKYKPNQEGKELVKRLKNGK
ncbi:MAG: hypothetical protein K9N00_04135 [Candidatus Marinimicrobia bacterium]|nr:hypothetical protein [Candidatus Neomarinimicrobiota bacterium]